MIPTVFVNPKSYVIIEWDITKKEGFHADLLPDCCSYEIIDAYYNVLSVIRRHYGRSVSFGLSISEKSKELVLRDRLYLAGDSMGIAWLSGAMCFVHDKPFPADLLAWGTICPIRNGGFAVYKTDGTDLKISAANETHKRRIAFHRDEPHGHFCGRSFFLSSDMQQTIRQLEELIDG